ncbi:DNA repair protein RadA/Sms [Geodermatophilus bullaregiensis]|uniref:DNA repair protein RadA n=1 Tax=Geodermatophilus bullaregiensis TaxID=1564160 RepID=UPI0027DE62D9|nr:DNA repair protein RadA [Geodermatophilus bullaregiensis]MBM7807234.1 DNA repair protein RadA/Sms [Geodermatophilus bullaregiensis]
MPPSGVKSARPAHRCTECGYASAKWMGRCPECQAWGTLQEAGPPAAALRAVAAGPVTAPARPIAQVELTGARAVPTGIAEFDRVLGGGLVPGAVVLVAGEPGVGKSTLLLEVAHRVAASNGPTLVVSGEESAAQVRLRAERIDALHDRLYLAAETELSAVLAHVEQVAPTLLVLDSVQTVRSPAVDGTDGGASQVRAVATALTAVAKSRAMTTILVGHVTKDGAIAGPRALEHLVDVVVSFDGERHSTLRLVRATKNRFGPADEIGCFEIGDGGVVGVPDPSHLFVSRRTASVPGSCVTVTMEGSRPLLAEVQALVATSAGGGSPRRAVSGLDSQRVAMVNAVVERRGGVRLADADVFAASVGGVKIAEPAADLALALAIASASRDTPLPEGMIALGEVGLSGEIRRVGGTARRLAEAARQGYRLALVPPDAGPAPKGIRLMEVPDLGAALAGLFPG